jgi:hypothetical protein
MAHGQLSECGKSRLTNSLHVVPFVKCVDINQLYLNSICDVLDVVMHLILQLHH